MGLELSRNKSWASKCGMFEDKFMETVMLLIMTWSKNYGGSKS